MAKSDLELAPPITALLKQASGGLKYVIAAMRLLPDDPVLASFLRKYDAIPVGDRSHLPFEAIALSADLNVNELLGAAMVALQALAVNSVKIIAMSGHPKITAARVKFGQRPSGERDRTALDTAMGFLPSPKGPTFIGKAIFGSGKTVMDEQGAGKGDEEEGETLFANETDPDLDKLFPPSCATQERLVAIRKGLPAPQDS